MPSTNPTTRPITGMTKNPIRPNSPPKMIDFLGTPESCSLLPGTAYFASQPASAIVVATANTGQRSHAVPSAKIAHTSTLSQHSSSPGSTGTTTPQIPMNITRPHSTVTVVFVSVRSIDPQFLPPISLRYIT